MMEDAILMVWQEQLVEAVAKIQILRDLKVVK